MGTTVSRPQPRRDYIESEIDDEDDDEEEDFEDEEEFDPSQWISDSMLASAQSESAAATAPAEAMPTNEAATVTTKPQRKLEASRAKQHKISHEHCGSHDNNNNKVKNRINNLQTSEAPVDSRKANTTRNGALFVAKKPVPKRNPTVKIIVNDSSVGDLPFEIQTNTILLGRLSKKAKKRERPDDHLMKQNDVRVVTPVRKPDSIYSHSGETSKSPPTDDINTYLNLMFDDEKKFHARHEEDARWTKEDDEPMFVRVGDRKSLARNKKWDDEDKEPIIKKEKIDVASCSDKLEWAKADLEPILNDDDSKQPISPNEVKSMSNGSDLLGLRSSQVDTLKWKKEDEEPIMKVLNLEKNEQLQVDTLTSEEDEGESLDADNSVETMATDCEESYEQPVKRQRLGNKHVDDNLSKRNDRKRNGVRNFAGKGHQRKKEKPQTDDDSLILSPEVVAEKLRTLLVDKVWESDDRGRTIWTADRDETLCIAVALQSRKEVADWEEIRRAVGASSICSVQHRWVRVKHRKPTAGLLQVMDELKIPFWPIELRDKWTKAEIKLLYELIESLADYHYEDRWAEISRRLGRTVNAVQAKFTRMNKKLAKQKERLKSHGKKNGTAPR